MKSVLYQKMKKSWLIGTILLFLITCSINVFAVGLPRCPVIEYTCTDCGSITGEFAEDPCEDSYMEVGGTCYKCLWAEGEGCYQGPPCDCSEICLDETGYERLCYDQVDNDCDGFTDCNDNSCNSPEKWCCDTTPTTGPGQIPEFSSYGFVLAILIAVCIILYLRKR